MRLRETTEAKAFGMAAITVGSLMLLNYFVELKIFFYLLYPGIMASFYIVNGNFEPKLADALDPAVSFAVNTLSYIPVCSILLWALNRFGWPDTTPKPINTFKMRRIGLELALLLGVLATLVYLQYRQHRMLELYHTAIWGGTAEADAAVVKLSGFHGKDATTLLFAILSPENRFPDNRHDIAVQLLAKRRDPQVAARLAELLQPHSAPAVRAEVSNALLDMECNRECTQFILRYLERKSRGELIDEDAVEYNPPFPFGQSPEQDEDLNKLGSVLWKDQVLTIRVLEDDYGLGTNYPSRFALQLVGLLHLKSACPALGQSKRKVYDHALREQVLTVAQELKCPVTAVP